MAYRFDRHWLLAQGLVAGYDLTTGHGYAQNVAEHCGDVQQMVQLYEKQLGTVRELLKSGMSDIGFGLFFTYAASSCTGLELSVLHPFGTDMAALLESCEGQYTDPEDCKECYQSSDWKAYVSRYVEGYSSKDGLHHVMLKPTIISTLQAILSLSLASAGTTNFSLSWLDDLPSADDPKLHDGMVVCSGMTNMRPLIAEVLEWQGRYKEAIRCVNSPMLSLVSLIKTQLIHNLTRIVSPAALLLPSCKRISIFLHHRRCVQGGCSADVTRPWGSTPSRCRHSMRRSSWRGVGASCFQRHSRSETGH
jgi:hypothetical protein